MKTFSTKILTQFAFVTAALVLAAFVAPLLAQAQSNSANDLIELVTGKGKVTLQSSSNDVCTATSNGHVLAVAIDGRCSSFGTSVGLPDSLSVKIAADEITFRSGASSYVIRDPSIVSSARTLFAPLRNIMQHQSDLGQQMRYLGASERDSVPHYTPEKVSVPDVTAEFEKVEADAKRLSVQGGTQSQLSELQSELSELQARLSKAQSEAGAAESRIGEQALELKVQMKTTDELMKAMGGQMQAWSSRGQDSAVQAAQQLKTVLDDAIAKGIAKPE